MSITYGPDRESIGTRRIHDPVGFCIYCGSAEGPLTDEHPIPDGLGGRHILPQASCRKCQKIINEEFEQYCLRTYLGLPRAAFDIRSSRKRPQPRPSVRVRRSDGSVERVQLDEDIPPILFMPVWPLPFILQGQPAPKTFAGRHWAWRPEGVLKKLDAEAVISELIEPPKFARWLAKMAHAQGVAAFGADFFKHELPAVILGEKRRFIELVGGSLEVRPAETDAAILMGFWPYRREGDGRELIVAHLRLFPLLGAPDYIIVLGEVLKPWPDRPR